MNKRPYLTFLIGILVAVVGLTNFAFANQQKSDKPTTYLFVQNAHSGSFVPVEGEENLYTLTIEGVSPQAIYFSDRPKRDVGQVPMQKFLDGLGFSEDNPPNAALEIMGANEDRDVVVIELLEPRYDAGNNTLRYKAIILEEPNHNYAVFNERHDGRIPEEFGAATLFIDDCPDKKVACETQDGHFCGHTQCCQCWDGWHGCTYKSGCCSRNRCENKCKDLFGSTCNSFHTEGPVVP